MCPLNCRITCFLQRLKSSKTPPQSRGGRGPRPGGSEDVMADLSPLPPFSVTAGCSDTSLCSLPILRAFVSLETVFQPIYSKKSSPNCLQQSPDYGIHICLQMGLKHQHYFLIGSRACSENLPLKVPNIITTGSQVQTDFGPTESLHWNYPQKSCLALLNVRTGHESAKTLKWRSQINSPYKSIKQI